MLGRRDPHRRFRQCQDHLRTGCLQTRQGRDLAQELARFWQTVPINTVIDNLPPQHWDLLTLKTYTPCITVLNEALLQQNHWISAQDNQSIERQYIEYQRAVNTHTLEQYLADADREDIDVAVELRRLKGLLVDHQYRVSALTTKYYQRRSSLYYHDIRALTYQLFHLSGDTMP